MSIKPKNLFSNAKEFNMTSLTLYPFKKTSLPNIELSAEINKKNSLFVSFRLTGELDQIDLGTGHPKHQRAIGLWNKTCFELFIKNGESEYLEFNFSPDFEWNAFYFSQPGKKLTEYPAIKGVKLDILYSLQTFLLIAEIDHTLFPNSFLGKNNEKQWSASISAVIQIKHQNENKINKENSVGPLTYWALKHSDTKPNFHHFDSFIYKF